MDELIALSRSAVQARVDYIAALERADDARVEAEEARMMADVALMRMQQALSDVDEGH